MLDQIQEQIEGFGSQRDGLFVVGGKEQSPARIEVERAETVDHMFLIAQTGAPFRLLILPTTTT